MRKLLESNNLYGNPTTVISINWLFLLLIIRIFLLLVSTRNVNWTIRTTIVGVGNTSQLYLLFLNFIEDNRESKWLKSAKRTGLSSVNRYKNLSNITFFFCFEWTAVSLLTWSCNPKTQMSNYIQINVTTIFNELLLMKRKKLVVQYPSKYTQVDKMFL